MKQLLYGLGFAALSMATVPAIAQTQPSAPAQQQAAKPAYADQMVCETEEEIGSRLASHKICHTRSQWAQIHQDERSQTEHTQMQRTMINPGH